MAKKVATTRPTGLAYTSLDVAHEFFNRELFGGSLPPALISYQRHPKAYAYYCGGRFVKVGEGNEKVFIDEIAMNPMFFAERAVEVTLSTLVHEMAHQWQKHHGKEPSRCYHDKQWAAKMKDVGLQPSTTGQPGGKETGPRVSHYIIEGGPFSKACAKFVKDNETALYQDRNAILRGKPKGKGGGEGEGEGEGDDEKPKSKGRAKFQCKGCELLAWAKPGAKLRCDDCDRPLHRCDEEKESDDDA